MEPVTSVSPFELFTNSAPSVESIVMVYGWALRLLFWAAFILYFLFAVVVVRQVTLMDETIKTPLAPVLKIISWSHLIVALMVLVLALISL